VIYRENVFFHACTCILADRRRVRAAPQGFNWESCKKQGGWYKFLQARVDDIANAGATHVWLPPPSHSVAPQGAPLPAATLSDEPAARTNEFRN